jgi:hypothetical protein
MNKKRFLILATGLIIAAGALTIAGQTQFAYQALDLIFGSQTKSQIPDYVLYDNLFRMLHNLKKKAESPETSKEKSDGLTNYFRLRANLSDEENQALKKAALEFIQEVTPIDAQAGTIAAKARQTNPKGIVSPAAEQTTLAELANLQEQRNALALRYRDRLKESLGADEFAKFDKFVQGDFASRIKAVPLSPVNFDQKQ